MPPIFDDQPQAIRSAPAGNTEKAARFPPASKHVEHRDRRRRLLDRRESRASLVAQFLEQLYSSCRARSSAPRIFASISFNSGVMKRSPSTVVCLRV